MRKGLLTEDQENFFAALLDDVIKFKNPILEGLDKPAFKLIISNVDNLLADRIPEDWQNPLEPIIDAAVEQDWVTAGTAAGDLINEKIDIPGIDEVSEGVIIHGIIQLILGAVLAKSEAAAV